MREMNCPFGCQTEEGESTVYRWDEETFKCSVCKARWKFVVPPEDLLDNINTQTSRWTVQ
ncbi:MAG: hypothetical protein ACFFB5_11795 [Promethearchaeota archaeon]